MRSRVFRYCVIQSLFWINFAIVSGQASVYLRSQSLDDTVIGAVVAGAGLGSALLAPRIAMLVQRDRERGLHRMSMALLTVFSVSAATVMLLFGRSPVGTAVAWGVCALMMQCMLPLVNSLAITTGVPFGGPRAAGSVGYAIVSLIIGQALRHTSTFILPGGMLIVYLLLMIAILLYPQPDRLPTPVQQPGQAERSGPFLKRYPELALLMAGSVGLYLSHMVINTFAFQIVVSKGGGSGEMNIGNAIAAVVELPVMVGFHRINRRFSARTLLWVSGVFFTLKALFTLLSPNFALYYLTMLLQMGGFALTTVASVQYIRETIPQEDAVKGQAWYAMSTTIGSVIGAQAGGIIRDSLGVEAMLIFATAMAALGSVVVFAAMHRKAVPAQ